MQFEEEAEKPKITFEMSAKNSAVAELREEDVEELLEVVKEIKENVKPKGSKMKMDTVSLSLTSSKS
jgi:PP-loop superfamily ATP-utilizing enzyme